jgi:hypothetical protein
MYAACADWVIAIVVIPGTLIKLRQYFELSNSGFSQWNLELQLEYKILAIKKHF